MMIPACDWCQAQVAKLHRWTDFDVCPDCLATLPEMPIAEDPVDDDLLLTEELDQFDDEESDDAVGNLENAVRALEDGRE